ncbi:MAG: polyribonucleotide nucleotidyltransferase [Deltaproteobacteria bacterium]|nr:polyribonucleotide nucleotidyltransferase [Deltaproteobacteria bacterium]
MQPTVKTIPLGDKELTIDVGRVARQADAACLIRYGDTVVLTTAVASKKVREGMNFMPLTVDYRQRTAAAGKIPGGFFKREGRPSDVETMTARITDRSIRPMFPKGWRYETQIITLVLSADGENSPDVLSAIGASVALNLSNIPFEGPMATVRVGRVDGKKIVNPTFTELEDSDMDIVITATETAIAMVEGECKQISESDMIDALMFAFEQCQPIIQLQKEMMGIANVTKREFTPHKIPSEIDAKVREWVGDGMAKALGNKEKMPRYQAFDDLADAVKEKAKEAFPDMPDLNNDVYDVLDAIKRDIVRGAIAKENKRIDGRDLLTVRPISIDVGVLPRTHGSALFTRGETQAMVTTTLGTGRDEQLVENLEGEYKKQFMLHYNFPPFCVGEARFLRGPARREIGHGMLAERAIKAVLPKHEDFPYTIRIISDTLESNGSSSMAAVCGGCMSLLDAGVKLIKPVAGVAMGLIKEGDDFHVLTDILGDEDHLGDMDFKVAGSEAGITAIQMDIKIKGVDREVLTRALAQAKVARQHVLGEMAKALPEARSDLSRYAPRITTLKIKPDRIKDIIGPGGRVIKEIVAQTGCSIDVEDDGTVKIGSSDPEKAAEAVQIIKELTQEAEVGKLYMSTVKKITDFGAFCEILPGTDGLLHISELSDKHVEKVTDLLREGDEVLVKCIGIDRQGKIRLSRKEALEQKTEEK